MNVIIESPFKSPCKHSILENIAYARLSMQLSLNQYDESPIAFHTLYTQVLNDDNPLQRQQGINASLKWYKHADKVIIMVDHGISIGMKAGYNHARSLDKPIEFRTASHDPIIINTVSSWLTLDDAIIGINQLATQYPSKFYKNSDKCTIINYFDDNKENLHFIKKLSTH